MRRCLIILVCSLASFSSRAQVPPPGVIAEELANNPPAAAPDQAVSIKIAQVSTTELASSSIPVLPAPMVSPAASAKDVPPATPAATPAPAPAQPPVVSSKPAPTAIPAATPAAPPVVNNSSKPAPPTVPATTPIAAPAPTPVVNGNDNKLAPPAKPTPTVVAAPATPPAAPAETVNSLAPPPDPKPAPLPVSATAPMTLRKDSTASAPAMKPEAKADSVDAPRTSVNVNRYDGEVRDSIGLVSVPTNPDVAEGNLLCFQRVDYLRKHNDPILASAYLREVVMSDNILPQDRARAILELADSLASEHQEAEELCWLKIWMELYITRPEYGAVAYRVGTLYREMGLSSMARDAYYLALAHAINQGQVQTADDLKRYTRLTEGTLWELAANEYQSGQWARAAELFARYRNEATAASPASMEKAAFLQADCYYQLKQADKAVSLYEATLKDHPFNPLVPQARLRLYHLYVIKKEPENAKDDLEALAWTVRTVWPKEETYWQKQTAELLLALNEKNGDILPPLLRGSSQLPPEGKTWQDALDHYDALVSYESVANGNMDTPANLSRKAGDPHALVEATDLMAINNSLNQLPLPLRTAAPSP